MTVSRLLNNRKGVILIAAALAVIVVLGLSAAFFLRSVSEKRVVDVEKFVMQADFLAEAGANHGLSELKERIDTELKSKMRLVGSASVIQYYYTNKDSLSFLSDYAYGSGETKFTVSNNQATLTINALSIVTGVQGTYTPQIIITSVVDPENPATDTYKFYYNYAVQGTGLSTAISPNISKQVILSGSFDVTVKPISLASFALFTINHTSPSGTTVWFTENTNFTGPVHTNDRFSFAHNPSGHFTHEITQHLDTTQFYNDGDYILLNDDHNSDIDVPIFDEGFERSVPEMSLGSINSDIIQQQALGTMEEPDPVGIYVPNQGGQVTGGIYIKGDVSNLQLGKDGSNNPQFIITQGSTIKTITVNYTANTTTVQTYYGGTETYSGVPDGIGNQGIVIYSENKISSLYGTVQRDSKVTVSSQKDIIITNHIQYQDYNAGPPVNATGYDNMLGVISWEGDVRIGTAAPDNIQIHSIIMAPEGCFKVDNHNSRPGQGTATLLGGVIAKYYGAFGTFAGTGYNRNFVYDARVLSDDMTPPYFPTLTIFNSEEEGLDNRPLWQKFEN